MQLISLRNTWSALAVAFILAGAFTVSLFFHGYNFEYFGIAQALLMVCAARVIWQGYEAGFVIPRTALTICLTLFWFWLGVALVLSPIAYTSTMTTWWIGTLPLVFWVFTLAPDRDAIWNYVRVFILIVGVALAVVAAYQFLVLHESPRSVFLNINSHAALLNLIALPVTGYFFMARTQQRRWTALSTFLATSLFLLVYGIAITKGRAAALTFVISAVLLLVVSMKRLSKRDVVLFVALVVMAFVLANLSWQGAMKERYETIYELGNAAQPRFLIWQQAWEMLKDSPWWGRGLGLFSYAWPPYRAPDDSSAGYFVHNDYLQIWIELGLPGLVFFLAILISTLWLFLRLLRNTGVASNRQIELAGLVGGLFSVAVHSFFDFNFYIMAILMLSGLMLARIHAIATSVERPNHFVLRPPRIIGANTYRVVVALLALFPMVYFVSLALSAYEYERALALAGSGELYEADKTLIRATRLSPTSAHVFVSRADLFRFVLSTEPESEQKKEQAPLFTQAMEMLDKAEGLNPLNTLIFSVRGQLLAENPTLAGADSKQQAIQAYQHALKLNPRQYQTRLKYAKLLYSLGRRAEAYRLTEEGMRYWYYETEYIVPYYAFTARLRFEAGEKAQAAELVQSIERILKHYGWRQAPIPERPMFKNG